MIAIVGEAWGENEERLARPFVGPSGLELAKMLNEAGIIELSFHDKAMIQQYWSTRDPRSIASVWDAHPEVYLTNVFNIKPRPTNDIDNLCGGKDKSIPNRRPLRAGKYVRAEFSSELDRLGRELREARPDLIIGLGGTAAWFLTGDAGISKIRGTVCSSSLGFKCILAYHPAAILREWSLRHVTVLDLAKAKRESAFREIRRPKRAIWLEPSLREMEYFYEQHIEQCDLLSVDIETASTQVTCIGFAPNERIALVVPFVDNRRANGSYWPSLDDELKAWGFVRRVLSHPCRKLFQNGLFDIHVLYTLYGLETVNVAEDSMLLHHALQPESQKGLGFLGSVYTNEPAWKLMRSKDFGTLKRDE